MNITEILEYRLLEIGDYSLTVGKLISATIILLAAKILVNRIFRVIFKQLFRSRKVDKGRQFAVMAFIKYIVYTIAVLWALQAIGIQLSVIWGGAAALMVGIGLGLQQTFYDLISGIILLSEGTVEVGDVVSVEGIIGTVKNIGFRTSKVQTRDDFFLLIPNSKLVSENIINWSHGHSPTRFRVAVGVSYSSDVDLVSRLLLQAVSKHKDIMKKPEPSVRFKDFGNSSLDFEIHFYTLEYLGIEYLKSDVRFRIMELFQQNNVEIPFPQMDLWLKNANVVPVKENRQNDLE